MRADQTYERPAWTGLLTELVLPVHLVAWTRASAENDRLRPRVVSCDETDSDEDGEDGLPVVPGPSMKAATVIVLTGTPT
jgi:hypothetical protein